MTLPLGGLDNLGPHLDETYAATANFLADQNFARQLEVQAEYGRKLAQEPLDQLQQNLSRSPVQDNFNYSGHSYGDPFYHGDHF
jgi:hypothetical protein